MTVQQAYEIVSTFAKQEVALHIQDLFEVQIFINKSTSKIDFILLLDRVNNVCYLIHLAEPIEPPIFIINVSNQDTQSEVYTLVNIYAPKSFPSMLAFRASKISHDEALIQMANYYKQVSKETA